MKLIKIGRSSQCNLVLPSQKVSALHAEMTLMDDGEIILEDKSSTNGTFVGGNRIEPNTEVKIRRGDRVVFGDTSLNWNNIADVEKENSKFKLVVNIGKNYNNDIRLTSDFCSRYHAVLRITKDNKAILTDTGSKNGTKVNGVLIRPNTEKIIKYGDNVICGDEDITEALKPYIPNRASKIIKFVAAVACVAVISLGGYFGCKYFSGDKNYDKELAAAIERQGPAVLNSATVYVRSYFHYIVRIEDCPISSDIWNGEMKMDILGDNNFLMGTAFFVDREGRMITNRHVAKPWDKAYYGMFGQDIDKKLKQQMDIFMQDVLILAEQGVSEEALAAAGYSHYWPYVNYIYQDAMKKGGRSQSNVIRMLLSDITNLKKCKYVIDGEMDYIIVGYAGRNYTHIDEFERCNVLGDSNDENIDLAVLQLNRPKTPEDVKFIYDIK